MHKRIEATITADAPVFVGGDIALGNLRLPYMLHIPQDRKRYKIEKEHVEEFIKCVGAFYRNCNKDKFGKRSFTEAFRDRVYVALCNPTLSQFFTSLIKHLPIGDSAFYQYTTKLSLSLSSEQNRALLQWARENIDMFVATAVYHVDSFKFRSEFTLNEDILFVESDIEIPVIPGNTIRGLMRDQLMTHVIWNVFDGDPHNVLNARAYHTLFSGGMLTSSTGFVNVAEKRLLREKLPFLSILGTMKGNEDLRGKIDVNFALIDCLETGKNERSAYSFLKEYFQTRTDDYEGEQDESWLAEINGNSVQMIQSFIAIEKGSTFSWSVDSYFLSEHENMFFELMLHLFQKIGKIGGMGRSGIGKITIDFNNFTPDPEPAMQFLKENQESISEIVKVLAK